MSDKSALALAAIAHMHRPDPEGHGMGWVKDGYGRIEPVCGTCGTSDEYAVEWPCATFLAVTVALSRERLNDLLRTLGRDPIPDPATLVPKP